MSDVTTTETAAEETETISKSELAALRAQVDKNTREAEEAKRDAAERLAASGNHEELAKLREQERDDAKAELAKFKAELNVQQAAGRLKFRNADDALAILRDRYPDTDLEDDKAVDRRLGLIALDRPHLIDNGTPAAAGDTGTQTITRDQLKAMTPQQVAALPAHVVAATMKEGAATVSAPAVTVSREQLKTMTPSEVAALPAEVVAAAMRAA
jgi:hypothetical protein